MLQAKTKIRNNLFCNWINNRLAISNEYQMTEMNSEKVGTIRRLTAIATKIPFCGKTKSFFKVEGPSEIWNKWVLLTCNHTLDYKDLVNYREGQCSEGTIAYYDLSLGTISLWARLYDENDKIQDDEDCEVPNVYFNIETERIRKGVFEFRFLPSITKKERYALHMKYHQKTTEQIPISTQLETTCTES